MMTILGAVGVLCAVVAAWLTYKITRASTFFQRTTVVEVRKTPTIHEAENRIERRKQQIEKARKTREEQIKCAADEARKRISKKFGP
jgi:type VI protein secretion system component VasK